MRRLLKNLTIVASLCLILGLMAQLLHTSSLTKGQATKPLFPGLEKKINLIDRIKIENNRGIVDIRRSDEDLWVLPYFNGYPGNQDKINNLVLEIALLKAAKESHNIGMLSTKDYHGTATLFDRDGNEMASLSILDRKMNITKEIIGSYIQLPSNEKTLYLGKTDLDLTLGPSGWIINTIINIPEDMVLEVTPLKSTIAISRGEKTFLEGLSFYMVRPVADAEKMVFINSISYLLKGNLVIHIKLFQQDEKEFWINMTSEIKGNVTSVEAQAIHEIISQRHPKWLYSINVEKLTYIVPKGK